MTLGQILRKARLERCLTQKQLSGIIGVAPQTISYYESDLKSPALSVLHKYCEYFNLDPAMISKKKYEKEETQD